MKLYFNCPRIWHALYILTEWNLSPFTNSRTINQCQTIYIIIYLFICWWQSWESNANILNVTSYPCLFFFIHFFYLCYIWQLNFICENAKIQRRSTRNEERHRQQRKELLKKTKANGRRQQHKWAGPEIIMALISFHFSIPVIICFFSSLLSLLLCLSTC